MNSSVLHGLRNSLLPVLVVVLFLVVSVLPLSGCRSKDNPVGPPDGPQPGHWTLVLSAPPSMFRDLPGGHVENDTITVRLYNEEGILASGVRIYSKCDVSVDSVSPQIQSRSDTAAVPWGANPALIYWGSGGVDGREVVRSWALSIAQGDTDTLATAFASFKVFDPIE
ncbi:MAG: hypothetical protein ACOZB3_09660 [Calditrichota bacterium]